MLAFLRSPGRCYLLALASLALGIGVIYLPEILPVPQSVVLLSLPLILASVALLFIGKLQELRDRYRSAVDGTRDLKDKIAATSEEIRRHRAAGKATPVRRSRRF